MFFSNIYNNVQYFPHMQPTALSIYSKVQTLLTGLVKFPNLTFLRHTFCIVPLYKFMSKRSHYNFYKFDFMARTPA